MRASVLWQLLAVFSPLSLLAFGGGQSVVADIDHQVLAHGWMTQAQFVDLFAISRAAPGPGALLATLVGWKVAGWEGAVVASSALFVPSSLLAYAMTSLWRRFGGHPGAKVVERALAPIAAGLLLAGAVAVIRASSGSIAIWAIALVALAIFMLRPKLNPLIVLLVAGIAGVVTSGMA